MSAQIKKSPVRRAGRPKAGDPSLRTLPETSPTSTPTDRTPDGRFGKNNPGGPGNPHARHCARMLALLRASISDEEMVAIIRMLVEKARAGDVSAAKLIMGYQLGKPAPAPNPDEIDRNEWEHYQRDTIKLQEVQQVLASLPARVGNDIARTALPIMTQARKVELERQLVKDLPAGAKPTKEKVVATALPQKTAPISNGDLATGNDAGCTCEELASGGGAQPDGSREVPIPNRKSRRGRKGKLKPKKRKPEWLRQVAGKI